MSYKPTSLEKNYKHDLLTEHDLGVTIDLINPETYVSPIENPKLAEEDEKLLEEELNTPQDSKRSRCHNRTITWLKKTEYISTEFNRYGASSDKTETKFVKIQLMTFIKLKIDPNLFYRVGYNVKKKMKEESLYLDRDSQIAAINKTFEAAQKPITQHPGKPGITPVEVLPVFPDYSLWKYPFAQVMFDADPAPITKMEEMSQAMIRGVMDESGEQFVAYFLPTEDTINKRKIDELESREYGDGEEYEYVMAREYNWNVKNKATKGYEENYFFVWRDDCICYNELETRVRLSKRRIKQGAPPNNSKLVVKHRPLNEQEFKTQDIRMTQLEPPQEDEEPADKNAANEASKEDRDVEMEDKSDEKPKNLNQKSSASEKSSSSSSDSSSSSESSDSSSSSESDSDDEAPRPKKTKQDANAVFGSGSDSD